MHLIHVQGTDRKSNSRVKGEAAFAVIEEGATTAVELSVSFSITGKLAQFSREGIVKALEQDGIKCARRTVAKYREAMGLLSSSKRKRLF